MQTTERARKNESVILQSIAVTGLEPIAQVIRKDISTVSRMKEDQVKRFSLLLAACDLKVVPSKNRCVSPDKMRALKALAQMALNHPTADDLLWDQE